MDENKKKNGSFAIGLCIVTMIILILALGFMAFKYKTDIDMKNTEIEELKVSQKENEEKINELQDKINSVGNIVNDTESNDNQEIEEFKLFDLPATKYYINEASYDYAGVPETDCSVKLLENNIFLLYEGWGKHYTGKYKKEDKILTFKVDTFFWEDGGGHGKTDENCILKFEIINDTTLEIVSINKENNTFGFFSVGQTYSTISSEIEGTWNAKASYSINKNGNEYTNNKLTDILGTSYLEYGSSLTLNSDGTFEDKISPIVEDGTAITGTWEKLKDEEESYFYSNIKLKYSDGEEKILKVTYDSVEETEIINIEYKYDDNCYIILKK